MASIPDPGSQPRQEPEVSLSRAAIYMANERSHRRFTLPATADHADLIVSYSDQGCDPGDNPGATATILVIPGMFGSRFFASYPMHAMGQKLGVRVLCIDRPGMGHSTDVPVTQRIAVWLELVPQLLKHLGIEHVALVSHSAGTMYCLNTLYHLRSILHPERPLVALLAPWVDPAKSQVTAMQMLQYLPVQVFGVWHHIPRFFVKNIAPAFASSEAALTKMAGSSGFGSSEDTSAREKNRRKIETKYGLSRDMQTELEGIAPKLMFGEDTVGANSEALLCSRKGGSWGVCDDYASFVREFVTLEKNMKKTNGGSGASPRLKIMAVFAESDAMIGKKGQSYMEGCWKGEDGEFEDVLDFTTKTIDGVDHDTLMRSAEALEPIFLDVVGTVKNDLTT